MNSLSPLKEKLAFDWVFLKAKEIQLCVRLPCIGYEDQSLALLAAIEAGQSNSTMKSHPTKKKERELKRLTCSINYEGRVSHGGQRVEQNRWFYEAQNNLVACNGVERITKKHKGMKPAS